jgi:hypothetical protein
LQNACLLFCSFFSIGWSFHCYCLFVCLKFLILDTSTYLVLYSLLISSFILAFQSLHRVF